MAFDSLIVNAGRLRILTALAQEQRQEFVQLRSVTHMTDGNLATHARRLESAGMLQIDKSFRDGKPVTTFILTAEGRQALESHVDGLIRALRPESVIHHSSTDTPDPPNPISTVHVDESDWID